MTSHLIELTAEGQVTIPEEFRRVLALLEGDTVVVTLVDGQIRLSPFPSVVARTAGIFKHAGPPLSAEEERAAFEQAVADDVIQHMGG